VRERDIETGTEDDGLQVVAEARNIETEIGLEIAEGHAVEKVWRSLRVWRNGY
jgi:hypothetical protein